MADYKITVKLVLDNKIVYVPYTPSVTTAEDVCVYVCKHLGISPVGRHLFALRDASHLHLMPSEVLEATKPLSFELRIRYKVPSIIRLKKIDFKAFEYYFHQVRLDIIENKVIDLPFETNRRQLLGLGVTDMYRVMLENKIPQDTMLNDYKKYIPKEVLSRHSIFVKKPIKDALSKLSKQKSVGRDASFVIDAYLAEFELMAAEYPLEEYKACIERNGSIYSIVLRVSPFSSSQPGIKYCLENKRNEWHQICTIEEVCFISIREDTCVELSRRNGIPFYVKFDSLRRMRSFVSLVDGYYRLSVKWTFNLCKEVSTPSLQKLYALKCHGPVGGEFSYAKLEEKGGNRYGCFILRESELKYNLLFLDVCLGDHQKPKTYKIERSANDELLFNDDITKYQNLQQLMNAYSKPEGIYLREVLPPSEFDNSPLLLCKNLSHQGETFQDEEDNPIYESPMVIDVKDLQMFSANKKESASGFTMVYKGRWFRNKKKKMDIAIKVLHAQYKERHLTDFIDLSGKWAFLPSNVFVKLFGVTLRSQLSMIMEYMPLGPLDQYLRENRKKIQSVDLIEASSNLATALWHLSENGIVHGNIRCKKVLVAHHDENRFTVKLSDSGMRTAYSPNEIHWIPAEFYKLDWMHVDYARKSPLTDVWAFATTICEIYMLGEPIVPSMEGVSMGSFVEFYKCGKRLAKPALCPLEIYGILLECWDPDMAQMKQPQAIMRDINQMLYEGFNSRQNHSYAKVKVSYDARSLEDGVSMRTETTSIAGTEDFNPMFGSQLSLGSESDVPLIPSALRDGGDGMSTSSLFYPPMGAAASEEPITGDLQIENVFILNDEYNIVLQGRIGQGFYGEVYKGTMEHYTNNMVRSDQHRRVAVKKMKPNAGRVGMKDFEREINIMRHLRHKNIVQIIGVMNEGDEIMMVMEYVEHGSLQSYLKIHQDTITNRMLLRYACDIAEGMDYLARQNIVHRDLATRNILVDGENHVKISDFGLARNTDMGNYYILKTERDLPIHWYALESLLENKFSVKSDVWSYGVTLTEMFLRGEEPKLPIDIKPKPPMQVQLVEAFQSGIRLPRPHLCPQLIYVEIIYPCWHVDPHRRPTFKELYTMITELLPQY